MVKLNQFSFRSILGIWAVYFDLSEKSIKFSKSNTTEFINIVTSSPDYSFLGILSGPKNLTSLPIHCSRKSDKIRH